MAIKRKLVAFHEAGHAVIARKLGITVSFIAMFPIDERSRATAASESAGYKNGDARGYEIDAKIALAGPAAQAHAFPGSIKKKNVSGDELTALSAAVRIAHLMAGLPVPHQEGAIEIDQEIFESGNSVLERLREETSALVAECWPSIVRVADALTHQNVLLQSDLDALIAIAE